MNEIPILASDSGWLVIWNDIKQFGASFWAFLIIFNLVFLKEQWIAAIKHIFQQRTLTKNKIKYTKKDIKVHPFFNNVDYWLNIGIKSIRLKCERENELEYVKNKEELAKEVIKINFQTLKSTLEKFIEETDLDNIDKDVMQVYIMDVLTKNLITQRQQMIENGIPSKYLDKLHASTILMEKIINDSLKTLFKYSDETNSSTLMYYILNTLNGFLSIIFNNMTTVIESLNGDLKGEMFKGKPMCPNYTQRLYPPHPTYSLIVKDKLEQIVREFMGSRAFICKYFEKNGVEYHSAIYEATIKGVTSEIHNIQMIMNDKEKNMRNIMKEHGCIAADLSKFGATTIERFNARGVKGIFICPIFNDNEIDGSLCIDFISIEKFELASQDKDLDNKLKKYAEELAQYIVYPNDYKF